MRLRAAGREHVRSLDMLFRVAWSAYPAGWAERIGPRSRRNSAPAPPRPASPGPTIAPPIPPPAPAPPPPPPPPPASPPDDLDEPEGPARGSANGRSKLTEEKVAEMRRLRARGWTYPELARRYGVGRVTIHYALSGRTWSHVPMADPPSPL